MSGTCSTDGKDGKCIQNLVGKSEMKRQLRRSRSEIESWICIRK